MTGGRCERRFRKKKAGSLTVYASNFGYSIPTAFKGAPDPILALVMANGALPIAWGNFAHIIDIAALCNAPAGGESGSCRSLRLDRPL
jgi:hypothetical protein